MKNQPNEGSVVGMIVAVSLAYNLSSADTGRTPAEFTGVTTTRGTQMPIIEPTTLGWPSIDKIIVAAQYGQ